VLTRRDPLIASGCHVGVIGHTTIDELQQKLPAIEIANGFFNRFTPLLTRRRQRLPHGGNLTDADFQPIAKHLRECLEWARTVKRVTRTPAANELWEAYYHGIPEIDGLLGAVTARGDAQPLRLSVIYALLDGSDRIDVQHLAAALAVWRYAYESAMYVFGKRLGYPAADRIFDAVRSSAEGLDREAIRELFARHKSAAEIDLAVSYLTRRGLVETESIETDGRSRIVTRLSGRAESAESAEGPAEVWVIALTALIAQGAS
jgi:hypothetical protein